jgi:hypothetical protein
MAKRINSKAKGKRVERLASVFLEGLLGIVMRRTAQVDGSLSADLRGWGGVHLEVKGRKNIAAMQFLRQAEADAESEGEGDVPVVLMKEDGDTDFVVMYRAKDFFRVAERLAAISGPIAQVMPCKFEKIEGVA